MAKTRVPDPLAETRRKRFQEFCIAKGWRHDGGRWKTSDIAAFFGKSKQAITNLLTGAGTFGGQVARDLEDRSHEELKHGELDGFNEEDDFQDVLMVDVRLAAGDGAVEGFEEVLGSLKFASSFLRQVKVSPAKARIVKVRGHSMHPTIPDGAVLLINTSGAAKDLEDGEIYALSRAHHGLVVKRLKHKDGIWIAISDNPTGPNFEVNDGEPIGIIGRAVWMGVKL